VDARTVRPPSNYPHSSSGAPATLSLTIEAVGFCDAAAVAAFPLMSLFGTSPEAAASETNSPRLSKPALFDDELTPSVARSGPTLFAGDSAADDHSPWDFPTAKRAGRHELIKTLLPASDVPVSYIDAYDSILEFSGRGIGVGVSLTSIKEFFASSALKPSDQAQILDLVVPGGQESPNGLERNEFNVLLALMGLAQEGEDLTFDAVDERKQQRSKRTWLLLSRTVFCKRLYILLTLDEQRASSAQNP
jgi:hypothetical protein